MLKVYPNFVSVLVKFHNLAEALNASFQHVDWENWGQSEGIIYSYLHVYYDKINTYEEPLYQYAVV